MAVGVMATYRIKNTIEAEQYDGSAASVQRIMQMLERTSGIMNTSEGYMMIDGRRIDKGVFITKVEHSESKRPLWLSVEEAEFNSRYEKID